MYFWRIGYKLGLDTDSGDLTDIINYVIVEAKGHSKEDIEDILKEVHPEWNILSIEGVSSIASK